MSKAKTASKSCDKSQSKKEWQVLWKDVNELTPYAKNARINDKTVPYLVNSIKRFGFKVPLVIDEKGVVVCGHTRLKAALECGMARVPCVLADDLTEDEIKAFRLADNKIQEMSSWDDDLLDQELVELKDAGIEMDDLGFGDMGADWDKLDDIEDEQEPPKLKGAANTIVVTVPTDLPEGEIDNIRNAITEAIKGWSGCEVE